MASSHTQRARTARAEKLISALEALFPDAGMQLQYRTTWELLVAVMLSAQCTDKKVNEVTETLFAKYRTLDAYVHADPAEFERDIRPTGFYKSKTKHILAAARKIKEQYGGTVPQTMDALTSLPGVARKTANVVLGNAFGIVEGIAVDTHVKRFAQRFDLTDHTDPDKIEQDLMAIVPKEKWFRFTYLVIEYGRQIAPARAYDTSRDPLVSIYPPAGKRFK